MEQFGILGLCGAVQHENDQELPSEGTATDFSCIRGFLCVMAFWDELVFAILEAGRAYI